MITDAQSEALYNRAREFGHCDIVIEPLAGDEWVTCFAGAGNGLEQGHLRHEFYAAESDQAPLLIRLPLKHFDVLDSLAGIARREAMDPTCKTRSVCAFIQSALTRDQLARVIERNLTVWVGVQKRFLRAFDPRVMHHLPALLPPGALDMRGIASWHYFPWDGEWARAVSAECGRIPSTPIRLTEEAYRALATLEHFNAAVRACLQAGLPWPVTDTDRLRQAVRAAVDIGLAKPSDVATYLLRARQWRMPPGQHPRWPEAAELVATGVPLVDALEVIGPPLANASSNKH